MRWFANEPPTGRPLALAGLGAVIIGAVVTNRRLGDALMGAGASTVIAGVFNMLDTQRQARAAVHGEATPIASRTTMTPLQ